MRFDRGMLFPSYGYRTFLPAVALIVAGCASGNRELHAPAAPLSRVQGAEFQQAMGAVMGPLFVGGNRLTTLENGRETFPAMLAAIRAAQRTITFEMFVFYRGKVPQAFAEALAERARAGVKVHVLLDGVGGFKSSVYHSMLRESGVELEIYHPIWRNLPKFNNRTHRRIMVIDGRGAFVGGIGIGDEWQGDAESPSHWHDLHYRVEGPVVAQLQAIFMDNWMKSGRHLLHGPDYFPPLRPVGSALASAFYSSPEHGSRNLEIMLSLAISSARKSLYIENAYFVPDRDTVDALVAAAKRGVRVQIIVPGPHTDQKAVSRASRTRWGQLLRAGVEIYEYQPTMTHTKLLIADGLFVSVGSANLDFRSLRANAEANLNVLDASFAAEQTRIFQQDLASSKRVLSEELRRKILEDAPLRTIEWVTTPLL